MPGKKSKRDFIVRGDTMVHRITKKVIGRRRGKIWVGMHPWNDNEEIQAENPVSLRQAQKRCAAES